MAENETDTAQQTDAEFAAEQKAKLDQAIKATHYMRREESELPTQLPSQREAMARRAGEIARRKYEAHVNYTRMVAAGLPKQEAFIRSGMDLLGSWTTTHPNEPTFTRSDFVTAPTQTMRPPVQPKSMVPVRPLTIEIPHVVELSGEKFLKTSKPDGTPVYTRIPPAKEATITFEKQEGKDALPRMVGPASDPNIAPRLKAAKDAIAAEQAKAVEASKPGRISRWFHESPPIGASGYLGLQTPAVVPATTTVTAPPVTPPPAMEGEPMPEPPPALGAPKDVRVLRLNLAKELRQKHPDWSKKDIITETQRQIP